MPRDNAQRQRNSHAPRRSQKKPLYAAVDLGTNNCRLLVARRKGNGFSVIDSHSQIARLGEGLATTGTLSGAAMDRAFSALTAIRAKLRQHGVGQVRCIATEACRRASNGPEFVHRIREKTGLTFKIIRPREEAQLAAIGCHDLIEPEAELVMVLDIGGGSTEISFLDMAGLEDRSLTTLVRKVPLKAWASFPLGVVTLSESFAHLDEIPGYEAMVAHAHKTFSVWSAGVSFRDTMQRSTSHLIGTSGTVTCLAGVHKGLQKYRRDMVDGIWLSSDEASRAIKQLRDAGPEGRIAMPTIGRERAGLMLSGCAILQAACEVWPAPRLRVADRGLREGLLLSMIHGGKSSSRRRRRRRPQSAQSSGATHDG